MKHEIKCSPVPFHFRVFPQLQLVKGHKTTDVLSLQCLDLKAIIEIIFQRIERTEVLTEYNNNSEPILITQCSVLLYQVYFQFMISCDTHGQSTAVSSQEQPALSIKAKSLLITTNTTKTQCNCRCIVSCLREKRKIKTMSSDSLK